MPSQLSLFDTALPAPAVDDNTGVRPGPSAGTVEPATAPAELAALAAQLPPGLRLGTSSWSFPGWAGLIYAGTATKTVLSRDGLTAYAHHPLLGTVGVDSGFYAPLDARRLARWALQVPADFRFLVKAPAVVTQRFVRERDGRWRHNPTFLDVETALRQAVEPYTAALGERAGVLLFQFPPQGRNTNPRRFAEDLYRFLKRLPAGPVYAVEPRDADLLTPDLAAALHHGGAVPSLACHPRLPELTAQRELFAVQPATDPLVIRWLLRRNRGYDEARDLYDPFDRLAEPDPDTRQAIAALVSAALAQGREVFVIVNNKAEGSSPLSVIELAQALVR
ncbi:MAG: DUF72 domain-containing protein [Thiohalocapsa sp.]|jgi:uncharacterized protein YecE (DUF72 family)|uniref:DUF72 domain-containing protein n=1 Tax=Thiohalocapsa sp. TaxID=2497641 RepID=UPI0025F55AB2|nr:DUF72 domain-containing protein [Thiohalocapsa sp.]MCG6943584.1 DUF72 domain-containing protein [Thiohalocapsa sp.]